MTRNVADWDELQKFSLPLLWTKLRFSATTFVVISQGIIELCEIGIETLFQIHSNK